MNVLEKNSFVEADVVWEVLVRMRKSSCSLPFLFVFKLSVVLLFIIEISKQVEKQRLLVVSLEIAVLEQVRLSLVLLICFWK